MSMPKPAVSERGVVEKGRVVDQGRAVEKDGRPSPSSSGSRRSRRRRLVLLGTSITLAVVLLAILFGTQLTSSGTGGRDVAPGVDQQSAKLLDLNVFGVHQTSTAPGLRLVDQHGQPVSLSQFRGKVVVWSLNDDRCTDLCALFAQDVVAADKDLGPAAKDVVFVSVNANPFYPSPADVRAWSVQHDLEHLPNWVYLTGTPSQLQQTWNAYHVTVMLNQKDRTVAHDAIAYFIDPQGRMRAIANFTQGSISTAYYAHAMAQMADDLLPAGQRSQVGGTDVEAAVDQGATVGDSAPTFSLRDLDGRAGVSLSRLEGKPLVVNFWSSTCSICTQEMPALQRVDSDFKGKVNFVGVDVADPRSSAASFARTLGVRYPLLDDPGGQVAADYRVDALPVTFVISRSGTILARHEGALTRDELVAVLDMDFPGLPQLSS